MFSVVKIHVLKLLADTFGISFYNHSVMYDIAI